MNNMNIITLKTFYKKLKFIRQVDIFIKAQCKYQMGPYDRKSAEKFFKSIEKYKTKGDKYWNWMVLNNQINDNNRLGLELFLIFKSMN